MTEMPLLLVTGATGFVGRAVCDRLAAERLPFRTAGRDADWDMALAGCGAVLHLAARVHVMNETARDPFEAFRQANVEATLALARKAVAAGVRRFIYVSSAKVNGEATVPGRPFTAHDVPAPEDPYAISKHEAERALKALAAATGLEVVVVRPPLVYGPGVKANFAALMRWVARGRPLPLGAIVHNRRSLVGLSNLVDLLMRCVTHPAAAGQVFLASDGDDLSTAELVRRMGRALGRDARLWPIPETGLRWAAGLAGLSGVAQRLCGSLQLDISHTRDTLSWTPPVSVDAELARTANGLFSPDGVVPPVRIKR